MTQLAAARTRAAQHPNDPQAHNELGMLLGDEGRFEEAAACFGRALAITPSFPQALHNLGMALMELGKAEEAEKSLRSLVLLLPHVGAFHADLGDALAALGRWDEAETQYRRALARDPNLAEANVGLGNALRQRGEPKSSETALRHALELAPKLARAHSNLGLTLFELGRPDEAESCFVEALACEPTLHTGHASYAYVLTGLGRIEEAVHSYRRALELKPTMASVQSNLAFLLNHIPGLRAEDIYAQHAEFDRLFGHAGTTIAHANAREPERRLRIGYVSADLRNHSVAFFIAPLLAQQDKCAFEIFCYYNQPRGDAMTERLKAHADRWRDVFELQDDALAELIRRDRIDILIDLGGHTASNRLGTFARKPAPVQATWLGYLNTTGLGAMDWRITDAHATPEGPLDRLHSERLVRLPDSQWCYEPPVNCPPVSPPPSAYAGGCTFAAFCTPAKVNDAVIAAWSRLLDAVSGSRLLVVASTLLSLPARYRERFARLGIEESRLQLLTTQAFADYLALHASVDIVLDTFPHAGGTTTCHAMWMGVPVVSLAGDTATSRGGASILHAVGLGELVAQSEDEYVAIATRLASDAQRLASLRAGMRERMRASPLMDASRFARNFESTCRALWRDWCGSRAG
jgi:predicted O-linked N-acetylglucosamine transferase (SPINDLY family)